MMNDGVSEREMNTSRDNRLRIKNSQSLSTTSGNFYVTVKFRDRLMLVLTVGTY